MRTLCILAAIGFLIVTVDPASRAPIRAASQVKLERVPDGGLQPQVAVEGAGGEQHLVYFKGDPATGDLYYVHHTEGTEWSKPIRVNSQSGSAIATGTIRGAHVALGRRGWVYVAWNGSRQAEPKTSSGLTPMLYTRLHHDGKVFEAQRNVMQRNGILDGGGAVAADGAGHVYVVWHAGDGSGESKRRVWVVRSDDDGASFARETPAWSEPTGACGCCGLSAMAGPRGSLYILYRAATNGEERDMYMLSSEDGGRNFHGMRLHPWHLNACPMTSASMELYGRDVLLAWQTEQQVYFARFDPRPLPLRSPIPVPAPGSGNRKFPALAVNSKGQILLAWAEGTGWQKGGSVAWQIFDPSGAPTGEHGEAPGLPAWSMPAVYARADGGFTILY